MRPRPEGKRGKLINTSYHEIRSRNLLLRICRIINESYKIVKSENIDFIVSFSAVPYGMIALLLGIITSTPVHIGFIGSDWYRHCSAWYGFVLNWIFKRTTLVTVTGQNMKNSLIDKGYNKNKIFKLTHAIDLKEYPDIPFEKRKYDYLFCGNLIERKRVDLIISALAEIIKTNPDAKLAILGSGPQELKIKTQVANLSLENNVIFMGHVDNPSQAFSNARSVVLASSMEGFPFALVEAIASGAVPIATDVGDISNILTSFKQGIIVPYGNLDKLTSAMQKILVDGELVTKIRLELIKLREQFGIEKTGEQWENIFLRGLSTKQ